ncbi:MAG: DNA polymerase III subunit gamma/tau [Desulfobacterales bacterium]|nr:DNA polymerase III subunit gamma/tau [Desulfobacterales bacterium]
MSYLVFARKYRPQTFDEVVKQDHVTRTLTNAISSDRMAHAILFSGPRGTGKTTVARILAKAMNCKQGPTPVPCNQCQSCKEITSGHAVDVFEIDGASNNGVEHIRDLRENVKYMPAHSRYKIYIIDEVHMLSVSAFNALLKTLEEPPDHVMFFFATTEARKIPVTILSRCQRHDFRRIDLESISTHLMMICQKEGVKISKESISVIAHEAGGSMRDALSLLDQVIAYSEEEVSHDSILNILGVVDRKNIFAVSEAVFKGDLPVILDILDDIYDRGQNMLGFYTDLIEHFRNLIVVSIAKKTDKLVDLPAHEIAMLQEQAKDASPILLNQVFDLLFKEEPVIRSSPNTKMAIEMIFIRIFQVKPVLPIDVLIEKIDTLRQGVSGVPQGKIVESQAGYGGKGHEPVPENTKALDSEKEVAERSTKTPDETLEQAWEKVLGMISEKHPSLAVSLAQCALKKISDNMMEIEINGSGYTLDMVKRDKSEAILKKICSQYFGRELQIKFKAGAIENKKNQKKKSKDNELKQEAFNHPLVADAIEIFDGKIVDVKIL